MCVRVCVCVSRCRSFLSPLSACRGVQVRVGLRVGSKMQRRAKKQPAASSVRRAQKTAVLCSLHQLPTVKWDFFLVLKSQFPCISRSFCATHLLPCCAMPSPFCPCGRRRWSWRSFNCASRQEVGLQDTDQVLLRHFHQERSPLGGCLALQLTHTRTLCTSFRTAHMMMMRKS